MMQNNPSEVPLTLDRELDHQVTLVLYGRAALCLGFDNPPLDFHSTLDVDAIISLSQLPQLIDDLPFWDALDRTNRLLQSKGLYLTHLFSEDQETGDSKESGRCAAVCGFAASLVRSRAWKERSALQAEHWNRSRKARQRRPMTDQGLRTAAQPPDAFH